MIFITVHISFYLSKTEHDKTATINISHAKRKTLATIAFSRRNGKRVRFDTMPR